MALAPFRFMDFTWKTSTEEEESSVIQKTESKIATKEKQWGTKTVQQRQKDIKSALLGSLASDPKYADKVKEILKEDKNSSSSTAGGGGGGGKNRRNSKDDFSAVGNEAGNNAEDNNKNASTASNLLTHLVVKYTRANLLKHKQFTKQDAVKKYGEESVFSTKRPSLRTFAEWVYGCPAGGRRRTKRERSKKSARENDAATASKNECKPVFSCIARDQEQESSCSGADGPQDMHTLLFTRIDAAGSCRTNRNRITAASSS
ncbi:unnamed protein product, partial [Amoebophrya sp. A120]|eukprot:GSA120T00004088001.1